MKSWTRFAAALLLVGASSAFADITITSPGRGSMVQTNEGPILVGWGGEKGAQAYIANLERGATLTDEQKKKIADIFAEREKAVSEFREKNAEKLKAAAAAFHDASKSGDADAISSAQGTYQQLYAPLQKTLDKCSTELSKVLTREQKAAIDDFRADEFVKGSIGPVKLRADQLRELKRVYLDVVNGRAQEGENLLQAFDRVLSPEQKSALTQHRLTSYAKLAYARANLTAQQSAKIDRICRDVASDPDVDPTQVYSVLRDRVQEVLTAEQKESMKDAGRPGANPAPKH
jgi:Spy/CpxP family protein refolding chaperone